MIGTEMVKVIGIMVAVLPGVKLNKSDIEQLAKDWMLIFGKTEFEELQQAALMVVAEHEYNVLPAPAKLFQALVRLRKARQPSAMEAWQVLVQLVRRHGVGNEHVYYSEAQGKHYPEPNPLYSEVDPYVLRLARFIGLERVYYAVCADGDYDAMRREFVREYEKQQARDYEIMLTGAVQRALPGGNLSLPSPVDK